MMGARRWRLATWAIALGAGVASAQGGRGDSTALSLPEVLARAVRASTPVLVGEDSLRVSGAGVLEAWGRYLPAVGAGTVLQRSVGTTLLSSTSWYKSPALMLMWSLGLPPFPLWLLVALWWLGWSSSMWWEWWSWLCWT